MSLLLAIGISLALGATDHAGDTHLLAVTIGILVVIAADYLGQVKG